MLTLVPQWIDAHGYQYGNVLDWVFVVVPVTVGGFAAISITVTAVVLSVLWFFSLLGAAAAVPVILLIIVLQPQ